MISHLDSSEVVTEFERDALGRLMTKASRLFADDKTTQREKVRFRYDALGRLVESYNEHQYLPTKSGQPSNHLHHLDESVNCLYYEVEKVSLLLRQGGCMYDVRQNYLEPISKSF